MRKSPRARSIPPWLADSRGAMLLELLIVISLMALIIGGLMPVLTAGEQTWDYVRRRQEMIQNARAALDHLTHTIRATQSFATISSTNIRLTYYFGDNATTRTVEYQRNATTNDLEFRRGSDAFQPLAGSFRSMSVACFDDTSASIACTSVSSVRSVQITLVVMDPQGEVADITFTTRATRQVP